SAPKVGECVREFSGSPKRTGPTCPTKRPCGTRSAPWTGKHARPVARGWRGAGLVGFTTAPPAPASPIPVLRLAPPPQLSGPHAPTFQAAVPVVVFDKLQSQLHSLRVHGNRAAHGQKCRPETAVWLLEEAFDLARWLFKTFTGRDGPAMHFQPPSPPAAGRTAEQALQEKLDLQERLKTVEAAVARLMEELQATQAKAQVAEVNAAELQAALRAGQQAADALSLDERTTRRRLIDDMLIEAGWNVGANGASTPQVGQEVSVPGQNTPSGEGAADYVL